MQIRHAIFVVGLLAAVCGMVVAKDKPAAVTSSASQAVVKLYAKPDLNANVIKNVQPNARIVTIFRQKDWIKVGDPQDGRVGWINTAQYREALRVWYQPDIQTVYVRSDDNSDGKPQVTVIAYQNGEQLSDEAAQALYQKMQKNQQVQWQMMQRFNDRMDRLFWRQAHLMDDMLPSLPVPIVVINQSADSWQGKK